MENTGLMLAVLLGVSLVILLAHFLSKRVSKSLAEASDRQMEIGGKVIFYTLKWIAILFLIYLGLCSAAVWPPHWLERMQQRKIVLIRVQEAGGWQAIKTDCESIVVTSATNGFQWFRGLKDEPPLPKSLAALKPRMVDLWPEKDGMQSIRIQIFGGHATGGRGQDFYILKVVCPLPPNVKSPFKSDPDAKVQYGDRKIVDGVYEVTQHS
jgi:hypothetical protein